MNHWYLKIPRFDGRKTLAFNVLVILAASAAHIWLVAGGSGLGWDERTWLTLLGTVAALNGFLRMVTERPVWWRQLSWSGLDLAQGESETVYHHAAEFVASSDFTDVKEREGAYRDAQRHGLGVLQGGKHIPYADFQRDLDKRLCDTREAFDGHVLPLDADERAS